MAEREWTNRRAGRYYAVVSAHTDTQCIIGHDPGGNGKHGVARLLVGGDLSAVDVETYSAKTVQDAVDWARQGGNIVGVGIDTLTRWSTGEGGWRPADHWLREHYPAVRNSVMSPNSLFGSMPVGGMCFMAWANKLPGVVISETHPRVAYYAVFGDVYDWENRQDDMTAALAGALGIGIQVRNDHEFDAVLSAYGQAGAVPGVLRARRRSPLP